MGEYKDDSWSEIILAAAFVVGGVYQLNNISGKIPSKQLVNPPVDYSNWAEPDLRDSVRDYPKAILNLEKRVYESHPQTTSRRKKIFGHADVPAIHKIPYRR